MADTLYLMMGVRLEAVAQRNDGMIIRRQGYPDRRAQYWEILGIKHTSWISLREHIHPHKLDVFPRNLFGNATPIIGEVLQSMSLDGDWSMRSTEFFGNGLSDADEVRHRLIEIMDDQSKSLRMSTYLVAGGNEGRQDVGYGPSYFYNPTDPQPVAGGIPRGHIATPRFQQRLNEARALDHVEAGRLILPEDDVPRPEVYRGLGELYRGAVPQFVPGDPVIRQIPDNEFPQGWTRNFINPAPRPTMPPLPTMTLHEGGLDRAAEAGEVAADRIGELLQRMMERGLPRALTQEARQAAQEAAQDANEVIPNLPVPPQLEE